jgi:hypothetical protein
VAPTSDPATATVEALQTQLAVSQSTATAQMEATAGAGTPGSAAALRAGGTAGAGTPGGTPGTPGTPAATAIGGTPAASATSQLAKTGFADEVGLPGLFILSILLVAVILLARRLRQAPLSH